MKGRRRGEEKRDGKMKTGLKASTVAAIAATVLAGCGTTPSGIVIGPHGKYGATCHGPIIVAAVPQRIDLANEAITMRRYATKTVRFAPDVTVDRVEKR